jgi:hypothetical protein
MEHWLVFPNLAIPENQHTFPKLRDVEFVRNQHDR